MLAIKMKAANYKMHGEAEHSFREAGTDTVRNSGGGGGIHLYCT